MKELKPLTTSCPLKLSFLWTNAGNTDKSTSQQQFLIFSAEFSKMKRNVELLSRETRRIDLIKDCLFISCVYVWMIFKAANFDISSSILCNTQVKIFCRVDRNHFPNFNKLQLLRLVTNSVTNRSWSLVYIQHDSLNLFKRSFWVARVINTRPFEFKWSEVRFNGNQTSMTPNYLLT